MGRVHPDLVGPASTPTFENNTITGQRISIWAGGHQATIRGNTLLDGAAHRLARSRGSSAIVEDNDIVGWIGVDAGDDTIIRDNPIRGGGEPADGRPGSAIGISGSGSAIVERNEIIDSPYGIDISRVRRDAADQRQHHHGSISAAILVDLGAAPTIDGNTIERNATGIEVRGVPRRPS